MSKVILDSDILIDLLKGRKAARVFVQELTTDSVPCCSVISVAEIYAGMQTDEREATATLLDGLVLFPVNRRIAEVAGHFKKRGTARRLELADCLIAATALVEGAAVATGNVKDYPMPEIKVLSART